MKLFNRTIEQPVLWSATVAILALTVVAVVALVFGGRGIVYAFDVSNNEKYKTGDRSIDGVDLSDPDIMVVYLSALGAPETGYVYGRAEGATVGDLLTYAGITYDPVTDALSHAPATKLGADMRVTLDRTVYTTETLHEYIPYETEEIQVVYAAFSQYYKNKAGKDGEKLVTYAVKTVNGVVTERVPLSEEITVAPVKETIYVDMRCLLDLGDGAPETYVEKLRILFTAYNYGEVGGAITATGRKTQVGYVAVDPTVIPYHSLLYVELDNGFIYGYCYAEDCGGGIKGNRIDLFLPTYSDMSNFGKKMGTCYIVRRGK